MTPKNSALQLVNNWFVGNKYATFSYDHIMGAITTAIEEDRAANAPLLAAAEAYREAWAARPSVDQGNYLNRMAHFAKTRDELCAAARREPAQTPPDFSKEPWNL